MRKGDEKRQEMLAVAEKLFCTKGYEATSIQDMLDVLHTSKGGFYHYFSSKEAVLQTLCRMHAQKAKQQVEALLAGQMDNIQRLNTLLYGFLPLRREETSFMNMLLPLLEKREERALCVCYQEALIEAFLPTLNQIISDACDHDQFHPPIEDVGDILLTMINRCWMDMVLSLQESVKKAQPYDSVALLTLLNRYRRCVEVLLNAPFGSIDIIRLEDWDDVAQRLLRVMNMPRV